MYCGNNVGIEHLINELGSSPYDTEKRAMQGLWRAVIFQAITDATSQSRKSINRRSRANAILWLTEGGEGFDYICHMAGYDVNYVKRKVADSLESGGIWKKDIRMLERIFK